MYERKDYFTVTKFAEDGAKQYLSVDGEWSFDIDVIHTFETEEEAVSAASATPGAQVNKS